MPTELTCVIHVHSVHSDGTGTIPEIAAAARQTGADVVIVTDHDDVAALGEAGWHDGPAADGGSDGAARTSVLVVAGHEVSPRHGSHLLALGSDVTIPHGGRTSRAVLDDLHRRGGIGFAAHPFSLGGWLLGRAGRAAPYSRLETPLDGIEVWSLVTDTLEYLRSPVQLLRFARDPDAVLTDPPARNLAEWDELGRSRRLPAIAGLDAHQYGIRRGDKVLVRTMSYARTFALLRTHALVDVAVEPGRDAEAATAALLRALAAGHAFLARDSLADATGFRFGPGMGDERAYDGPVALTARAPRPCTLRLWHDGDLAAEATDALKLGHTAAAPGVWRVTAHLSHRGHERTWVLSNPVYLR
jgi:hypothetical protein